MLLYSLLPLGGIVLLLKLGGIIGNYLTLALAASTAFIIIFFETALFSWLI